MRTILLATVLLFSACNKKKEEPKADPVATEAPLAKGLDQAADKAAEMAKGAAATATAAASVALANAADYEKKGTEMIDKVLVVFKAHGKDCDKLAADLTKLAQENRATFDALKAFEKANPAAEEAFDKKLEAREAEMEQAFGPAFDACKDHAGMKEAFNAID
jgi:hypothetical protein